MFNTFVKTLCQKAFDVKASSYKQLGLLIEKLGESHLEVKETQVVASRKEFSKHMSDLQAAKGTSKTWSKETYVKEFLSHMQSYAKAQTLATSFGQMLRR